MAIRTLLTLDDFERLPADIAENHELVNGELVDVSGNTPRHNLLRDRLIAILLPWISAHRLGTIIAEQEYDFEGNAHGPDVSFFTREKQPLVDFDKRVQRFVPDLAIEIASESDTYDGLLRKKERYRKAGTREVWLISAHNREIAIYRESGDHILRGSDIIASDLLPGWKFPLAELFRDL